jgi:hypothetical protein
MRPSLQPGPASPLLRSRDIPRSGWWVMGQQDKGLRVLVIDPDVGLHDRLTSTAVGAEFSFMAPGGLTAVRDKLAAHDVVVIGVDCPAGLALVADIGARPDMPPVIAICGAGFEGKSPEHILLLAELRGAAATLPKPLDGPDLVLAAHRLVGRPSGVQAGARPAAPAAHHKQRPA